MYLQLHAVPSPPFKIPSSPLAKLCKKFEKKRVKKQRKRREKKKLKNTVMFRRVVVFCISPIRFVYCQSFKVNKRIITNQLRSAMNLSCSITALYRIRQQPAFHDFFLYLNLISILMNAFTISSETLSSTSFMMLSTPNFSPFAR
jgi:hypothetical protein